MGDIIKNRYEFTILFDVENGNPNGDPDAGNMPRIDAETGYGIVTDVCIKRKIRNYVQVIKEYEQGYKIYVREGIPLDANRKWAYEETKVKPPEKNGKITADEPNKEEFERITKFMCNNFYDIRAFGAVMTLKYNCGQVRGPIQIGFARSVDVIAPQEITITSCTYANEGEKSSTMGRKHIIPYALYRMDGYVSANLAKKTTGFTEEDLALFWEAIINMFDCDHAAARGKMSVRELIVFRHNSELGNCPAYKLFDTINIQRKQDAPARAFADYEVIINKEAMPDGVTLLRMV